MAVSNNNATHSVDTCGKMLEGKAGPQSTTYCIFSFIGHLFGTAE